MEDSREGNMGKIEVMKSRGNGKERKARTIRKVRIAGIETKEKKCRECLM